MKGRANTLEARVRSQIMASPSNAFVYSDFIHVTDDKDQLGRVLRKLASKGDLTKIGKGVYAKTIESRISKERILAASFPEIAIEALKKLQVETYPSKAELDYNAGKSTQVPTGLMIGVNKRISLKLSYRGRSIKYEKVAKRKV